MHAACRQNSPELEGELDLRKMPKTLAKNDGYSFLLQRVRKVLVEGQRRIEAERVRTYWETGRVIRADILKHKDRAEYGAQVVKRLAGDLEVNLSVLQRCVQFAKAYPRLPIVATWRQFSWSHYRELITVTDEKKRSRLEKLALQNDWSVQQLASHIKKNQLFLTAGEGRPASISQLTFARGRLNTYGIVPANKSLIRQGPLAMDFGFREQYAIPEGAPRLKENDTVELVFTGGALTGVRKVEAPEEELFTYRTGVERVIDADTLLVSFDFRCPMSVSQKLRLRGINCPEMDTEEGKRAKRFVESRLKGCEFIIVKTYKDTTDKYDRYLADIFYKTGAGDSSLVACKGKFLNQELLDEGLAVAYE